MSTDQLDKPQSCYDLLGLSPEATDEQVKNAYRKLALAHHPDRMNAHNRRIAELRFRAINEAYAQLKTQERRAHYNRVLLGHNDNAPGKNSFWGIITGIFKPTAPHS